MFMEKPSVNQGKITSANSTHPTSQIAKQIPAQRNARNKRPIAKRFSARAQIGLCCILHECPLYDDDPLATPAINAPSATRPVLVRPRTSGPPLKAVEKPPNSTGGHKCADILSFRCNRTNEGFST
tara:strand:- start:1056 stop:1433 length:378 start_codon:yes stop_codon:yes gene_type:complete